MNQPSFTSRQRKRQRLTSLAFPSLTNSQRKWISHLPAVPERALAILDLEMWVCVAKALTAHSSCNYPESVQVNLQYAEEHFADLAKAADNGEVVEISRPDMPLLKLVVSNTPASQKRTGKRILGAGRGEMIVPTCEEWQAMDKELEREMLDAPLISSGEI